MTPFTAHAPIDTRERMRADVLSGLAEPLKRIPPKYLYDARGSALFEAICETPEYYIMRTEKKLLRHMAPELGALTGGGAVLLEPGSGNSEKAQILAPFVRPSVYVPVDICAEALAEGAAAMRALYPWIPVQPVCADFSSPDDVRIPEGRCLIFFPGSTIGNLDPADAVGFLRSLANYAQAGGMLLVGVDLRKDPLLLTAAYDDSGGVTAAFNLNLLIRINRELGGDFDPGAFVHQVRYDERRGCIEMHLVSRYPQRVRVAGHPFVFEAGESIHTESAYKYDLDTFRTMLSEAGWTPRQVWTDDERLVSLHYAEVLS